MMNKKHHQNSFLYFVLSGIGLCAFASCDNDHPATSSQSSEVGIEQQENETTIRPFTSKGARVTISSLNEIKNLDDLERIDIGNLSELSDEAHRELSEKIHSFVNGPFPVSPVRALDISNKYLRGDAYHKTVTGLFRRLFNDSISSGFNSVMEVKPGTTRQQILEEGFSGLEHTEYNADTVVKFLNSTTLTELDWSGINTGVSLGSESPEKDQWINSVKHELDDQIAEEFYPFNDEE